MEADRGRPGAEADGRCASATDLGGNRGACCWLGRLQRSYGRQVDSTGGRAQIEQIDRGCSGTTDLGAECQRMRFFLLTACGEGAGAASDGKFVVASLPIHSTCVIVVSICLHVFRQVHRLHSEQGQMINATAINAVFSFGGCPRWHHPGVEPAARLCLNTGKLTRFWTHS